MTTFGQDLIASAREALAIASGEAEPERTFPAPKVFPELAILRLLAVRTHASAGAIGIACRMTAGEVRARLVMLESMRLVAGRRDPDAPAGKLRRVYVVTGEGRRRAGVNDARSASP